jgi:PAS domain-containing protein
MEPPLATPVATADAPARRPLAPRRRARGVPGGAIALVVFGLVLLAGLWVTLVSRVRGERAEALEAEFGRNTNLALALDVQTQQLIQGIDQFLVLMRHQAEHAPPRVPLTELVAPAFAGTRSITLMGVFDARGDALESVSEFTATNAADRPLFQYHRDNPSRDLLVSAPVLGRISGRWVITFSRRVTRPDGGFGGMVLISLEPRYLTSLFEQTASRPLDVGADTREQHHPRPARPVTSFGSDISGSQLMRRKLRPAYRPLPGRRRAGRPPPDRGLPRTLRLSVIAAVATSKRRPWRRSGDAPHLLHRGHAREHKRSRSSVSSAPCCSCASNVNRRLTGAGLAARRSAGRHHGERPRRPPHLLEPQRRAALRLSRRTSAQAHGGRPAARARPRRRGRGHHPAAATGTGGRTAAAGPDRRVITQSRWTLVRDARGEPMSLLTIDTDVTERRQLRPTVTAHSGSKASARWPAASRTISTTCCSRSCWPTRSLYEQATATTAATCSPRSARAPSAAPRWCDRCCRFARGQDGHRVEVPVGPLVDDVVQIARDTLPKDIAISSAVEDGLPPLVGDPTQFHRVLLNLCVNARDAMPGGGRLHVSASAMSLPSLGEPLLRDAAAAPMWSSRWKTAASASRQ